jgi:predicted phage terminase large subunit-like protein
MWDELARRQYATESLLNFTLFTKPNYFVNWHHELVCKKLDQFVSGEIKRLIISMPPQNGKSELVSRRLPAYLFGKHPDCRIISCSYSADLAQRMNRDVQRIVDTPEYNLLFPDVCLNDSNVRTTAQGSYLRNSDIFEIVGHDGVYRSCGIGGGITGMSMDYGIIDDYLKNREEAESPTIRNKIWEWYNDVFLTREQGNSSILITATRWHEADLIGTLLDNAKKDEDADQWEVITLPAMSEDIRPEYDKRNGPNQPLWPSKYSEAWLWKKKANVPLYSWLSLYQQRPSAIAGNLVKKEQFKYCSLSDGILSLGPDKKVLLSQCRIFQTCDPAASTKTSADYFALATWAITPQNDLVLIDLLKTRLETPDQVPLFKQQYTKWRPVTQWVESRGLGISLFQTLLREGLPVQELKADTDKVTRFIPAATRIATGTVYFLDKLPGLHDFEEELLSFPNGAHDDVVDCVSYAVQVLINSTFQQQTYETYTGLGFSSSGLRI